jgi:hypothetical protein
MRFEPLLNLAQGQPPPEPSALVDMRAWSLDRIRRAMWALWHGQSWKIQAYLEDLCGLVSGQVRADPDANRDSLPNYGARYGAALPISTAFSESTINEVVAKRMNKNQQMRWNRYTVQPFLTVRVHVLNGTLEEAFRAIHRSFRPPQCPPVPP